jgi:predicted SnoaL-like aldol condensation-catalyzing enzyme
MSIEDNKTFVRRHFEEFVNRKNLDAADHNFASDYIEHGTDAPSDTEPGPNGPKRYLAAAFNRYPDLRVVIEDIVAEGDKVEEMSRKILESGLVRKLELPDPHLYFQAPGGQCLRLVGIDEDLSFYEGAGAGTDVAKVKEALKKEAMNK